MIFAIFRVGEKKYKDIKELYGYQKHMERLIPVANADTCIKNQRLIGSANIVEDTKAYIKGIKLRKNAVVARDLLLAASPDFFKKLNYTEKTAWVQANIKFLIDNFGTNCVYATLHKDESTWHISALIVPRFRDVKKGGFKLCNAEYFDGIQKLSAWQDRYSEAMKEFDLNRGIKYSKTTHVKIRQFYEMVNRQLDLTSVESICAKAKNAEVLRHKVQQLDDTLKLYKNYNIKTEEERDIVKQENSNLCRSISELQDDRALYRDSLKVLSEAYKIPQSVIDKTLNYVKGRIEGNVLEKKSD